MSADSVPKVLPVFPLTGSLLLPGSLLPLNIFEPRYRNMVEDAMSGERFIGMIQPVLPIQDNRPVAGEAPAAEEIQPDLYQVGCAGHIDRYEPQADGRFHILLRGVTRFFIEQELPPRRGYRQVEASYESFCGDPEEPKKELHSARLLHAFIRFAEVNDLSFDMERLRLLPGILLLNGLSVSLPFRPEEKQALLESPDPRAREAMLLSLMGMGFEATGEEEHYSPPVVN